MINLEEKTLSELKELAKESNIKNISKLKKEDLIDVLGQVLNTDVKTSNITNNTAYNDELNSYNDGQELSGHRCK